LAKAGKQSPPALTGDRIAHSLALQSIVREFRLSIDAGKEDSELLAGKHLRKRDKLAKTAVDDFHLQLIASN
jgi:hypothetical protein